MNGQLNGQPATARVSIEVLAGVIPGDPDPDLTRRWTITNTEWRELTASTNRAAPSEALAQLAGRAHGYATLLQLQPDRHNWVRIDWIWF